MRDHLLGCYQFQAVEPSDDREFYGCGVPRRVKWAPAKIDKDAVDRKDFETNDKTPVSMRADFPHEYDLHTMYGDAAKRAYNEQRKNWLYGDFGDPEPWIPVKDIERAKNEQRTASGLLLLQEAAKRQIDAAFGNPKTAVSEDRAAIVARILADKQALRPGKRPLALDL